jgi:hypothetical protein
MTHVPAAVAQDAGPRADIPDRVIEALEITVPPSRISTAYRAALAMLGVALVMIAAAFAALLAFMAWLVVWHLLGAVVSLSQGPYFIFHIPMAMLGLLLLVLLLKPLFFRPKSTDDRAVRLVPADEPLLFAFVSRLSAVIGATMPTVIEVDCEANAGAAFQRGWGGLARRQMMLRIGLPLAAAMSLRQFAGVLAHEFGHFNQKQAMLWSHLIRQLNHFFARIVFQRDWLDERLARLRRNRGDAKHLVYLLAVALIEPARGVLWLMLTLGQLLTCRVMRRMEYDADSVESQVAGSEEFARTNERVSLLQIAANQTLADLDAAYKTERLPDDLPQMIAARAEALDEHKDKILDALRRQKTRWFDTHPCHVDRVEATRRLAAPGALRCDLPATVLFHDFGGLCRRATDHYYRGVLDKAYGKAKLVASAKLVAEQVPQRKAVERLRHYYQGQVQGSRPLFPGLDANKVADDAGTAARDLAASREAMVALAGTLGSAIEENERASVELAVAEAHVVLANLAPNQERAAPFKKRARNDWTRTKGALAQTAGNVDAFAAAAERRLTLALQLVWHPSCAARIENVAAVRQEAACRLKLCANLQACRAPLLAARASAVRARVMYAAFVANSRFRPLEEEILATLERAVQQLEAARAALAGAPYPFEHGTQGITCADYLAPAIADRHDIGAVTIAAMGAMDRFADLSFRILAKLVDVAERVETALGLAPLAAPDDSAVRAQARARQQQQTRRYWLSYGLRAMAGSMLLVLLVWASINPPTLPDLPWEDGRPGGIAYRPASFSLGASSETLTMNYRPSPPPGQPNWYQPENPGYYQPGQPGHQPWMPTYWQPGYAQFYTPNVQQPGAALPPGAVGGGYAPGSYQPPKQYNPGAYGPRNNPASPQPGRPNPGGYSPPGGGYRAPGGGGHR